MLSMILTILLYITIYGSVGLIYKAADNSESEITTKRLVSAGILIMSIIASMREIHVGTDTQETILQFFTNQIGRNIVIEGIMGFLNGDILYYLLSNLLHFLGLGERAFLFIMELLILTPIGIVSYKKRDIIPMHYTMLIYSILYYQIGFNWIRQSAACSFILLVLIYAQEKRIKRATIISVFGFMIHSSAMIGLSFLVFSYTFMRIKNKYSKMLFGVCFMALFFFILMRWKYVFSFGLERGILPANYAGYYRVFSGQTTVYNWFLVGIRTYVDYAIRVLLVAIPLFLTRKNLTDSELHNSSFYKIISIMGLITYSFILFRMHSAYGNRITYSIEYIQVLNLGMCCCHSVGHKGSTPLRNITVMSSVILYNIWLYYVLGWHASVPFVFG